jgi:hypothetical protein
LVNLIVEFLYRSFKVKVLPVLQIRHCLSFG